MLTFVRAPNYENPADAGMDNTYMVTVKATDGTYMDTHGVTVMVTDVGELGMLAGESAITTWRTALMPWELTRRTGRLQQAGRWRATTWGPSPSVALPVS